MKIKDYILMIVLVFLSNLIYIDYYKSFLMSNNFILINNIMLIILSIITTYYTINFLIKKLYIRLTMLVSFQIIIYIFLLIYVNNISKITKSEIINQNEISTVNIKETENWKNTCLINSNYQFKIPFENPKSSNITKNIDPVNSFVFIIDNINKTTLDEIIYNNYYTNKIIYDKSNNEVVIKNMIEIIQSSPETKMLNKINLNDFLNFENIYNYYYSDDIFIPFKNGYLVKTAFQNFLLTNINFDFRNKIEYQKINNSVYVFKIYNKTYNKIKYKILLENNLELETENKDIIIKVLNTMIEKKCSEEELKESIDYNIKINNFENFVLDFMQFNSNKIKNKEKMDSKYIDKYEEIYPKDFKTTLLQD